MHEIEYYQTKITVGERIDIGGNVPVDYGGVQPFKEKPPFAPETDTHLRPGILFSLFTAEIIKENIVFTR